MANIIDIPEDLIGIPEAAGLVGRTTETLRRWIRDGRLRAWRPFGSSPYRVSRADVLAMLSPVLGGLPQSPAAAEREHQATLEELRAAGLKV